MVRFPRDPTARHRIRHFWAEFAAAQCACERDGLFAYNIFSVSRDDLRRLQALQRDYLRQMRHIVAQSEPTECVALLNLQLLALQPDDAL